MGVADTFSIIAGLPYERQLVFVEAALREPYLELQSAAFDALMDPRGLNRPDLIVESYPELLPEVKRKIAEQKWSFLGVARDQIRAGRDRQRRAAYEMLASIGEMEVAPILVRGLEDSSGLIREAVVAALEKLALRYHNHLLHYHAQADAASRKFIEEHRGVMLPALESLLRAFPVHRKNIFLEIVIESGAEAYGLITDVVLARREAPVYKAFLQVLSASRSESGMDLLFHLYLEREASLQQAAVEVMQLRKDPGFAEAIGSYFGKIPPDRLVSLAGRVKDVPWWSSVEAAAALSVATSSRFIEFLSKSAIEPERRFQLILYFNRSPHAQIRVEAIQALHSLKYPQLLDLSVRALEDPSDVVKVIAARTLIDLNPAHKVRLLTPLLNAPCEELRRLAMREVANVSFAKYMHSFDKLDARTRELAAKALAKIDGSMLDRLTEEVSSLDPERRLKALQIVEYVDAEKNLRELLMELLTDPDRRVRATVIKIVELSGNVEGMKLLIQALSDPDRRVRANAIEAFEDIGDTRFAQLLLPFLNDADNRVRANAAKALWNLGRREVKEVLESMLEDPEENMRLSAVWAIGELRYEGGSRALSARATKEPAEKVRAKIAETLARLSQPQEEQA